MKKFNISSQLLILVFSLLLLTSCIFMVITYASLHNSAEQQVYTRLQFAGPIEDRDRSFADMDIYFVTKEDDKINYTNIGDYLTIEEFDEVILDIENRIEMQPHKEPNVIVKDSINTKKGVRLYYVFRQTRDKYTFVYTTDSFVNNFVRSIFLRVFAGFLAILVLAVTTIYVWSTNITRRLRCIQNHIIDLPKNKYEIAYKDDSLDEIGELSRSVEQMRLEIGHYERTKQDMLQNLSHDFKTPIAVIKSYAEALQDGMAGDEAINIIIEQSELLKKKVNRLLQYNSLEYLTKDKPFESVNMTELVRQCVTNYKYQTSLEFDLDLDEDVCFLGYIENWTTVVDNIIDNAKRYAKSVIRIVLRENRLRIYNDGEAIDEQFLNSVFKPYEKGSKGQFGLGMSIVKKTVDFFGMYMSVKNEEYGGVSFIIEKK